MSDTADVTGPGKTARASVSVGGMRCAACSARVEQALRRAQGVAAASVNLATETATVDYDPRVTAPEELARVITGAGYRVRWMRAGQEEGAHPVAPRTEGARARRLRLEAERRASVAVAQRRFIISAVVSAPLMAVMLLDMTGLQIPPVLGAAAFQVALATAVQLYAGWEFYAGAIRALAHGGANMDVLIATGTTASYLYSLAALGSVMTAHRGHTYFETSATILTLVLLGRWLEARAKGRTSRAIEALAELEPDSATVLDETGSERMVDASELRPGQVVLVRPGERIPADGVVTEGASAVNESLLTGESMPVDKSPGSDVFGGTLNTTGSFRYRVTKAGEDTTLARIIRLVEDAQAVKAPVQTLADAVAARFVPAVLAVAAATFAGWLLATGDLGVAVRNSTAVLVIACPCALGLATPTAISVGMGRGAESGILVSGGDQLERAASVDVVAVDKTGTITTGEPAVTDVVTADPVPEPAALQVLIIAASAEQASEHPIARVIVDEARRRLRSSIGVTGEGAGAGAGGGLLRVAEFEARPGRGITATLEDGRRVVVGTAELLAATAEGAASSPSDTRGVGPELLGAARALEEEGKTVVQVAVNGRIAGLIALADVPKETARAAIAGLRRLGCMPVLLTGDSEVVARAVGRSVGFREQEVVARVLPDGKAEAVRRLRQRPGVRGVAMVGDGINDAPALAAADVGIAIGSGAHVAIESAGITLGSPDLRKIPEALLLARATLRIVRQNLFWAFFYNAVGIPLAAAGKLSPVLAGAAMALSSVSVVSNSLRLRRVKLA